MTSTPIQLLLLRSGKSSDRPSGITVGNGELALSFGANDPGLYFEDSAANIRKIGPSSYGTVAPNAVPVGLIGNSVGELWTDSNSSHYYLKVWTGSAWQKIEAGFADLSTFSTQSNSCITASGAITSNTSLLASGAVLASGAITSNTSLLASGAVLASGVVTAEGKPSVAILISGLPTPTSYSSGTLIYQIQNSGAAPSGLYIRVLNGWALT